MQIALPLTGLVSQLEPFWHGLLMHASSRWHNNPASSTVINCHQNCVTIMLYLSCAGCTCAPVRTLAEERSHTIVTGSAVVTSCTGTVVNVLAAVVACPPVDTDAVVTAVCIMAGSSVLTCVWHQLTLVHILSAVLTCEWNQCEYKSTGNLLPF